MKKRGMAFGVFDGLHEGHKRFLLDAATRCETLVVVVTRDEVAMRLKNKRPLHSYEERVRAIGSFNPDLVIVPGDTTLGEWRVLKEHIPHMIFLGYDQHGIAAELKKLGISFETLEAHYPEKYKSSLIRKIK